MKLEFNRIDPTLPVPGYATPGSVAFDLCARTETHIAPGALALVPANLIVKIPDGYALIIASRSSTPKKGLLTPHGIGVIDQDYRGPNDELKVQVYNFSDQEVVVARGDRIAQALIVPVSRVELVETEKVAAVSRGGFGSTG